MGLHTRESQRAIKRFLEINKEALYHPEHATRVALKETDESLRNAMVDLADRMKILSREATDRVIVTRSVGTALRENDALGALVLQFMTYPAGWFNGYLRRASQGPNAALAGYLGLYLAGEATAAMVRDLVYRGNSPEEVLKDWEENFGEKLANIAIRMPIAGPWSSFVLAPLTALATGERARLSLSSNPAFSLAENTLGSTVGATRSLLDGEGITDSQLRGITRQAPLVGSPPIQFLIRSGEE